MTTAFEKGFIRVGDKDIYLSMQRSDHWSTRFMDKWRYTGAAPFWDFLRRKTVDEVIVIPTNPVGLMVDYLENGETTTTWFKMSEREWLYFLDFLCGEEAEQFASHNWLREGF